MQHIFIKALTVTFSKPFEHIFIFLCAFMAFYSAISIPTHAAEVFSDQLTTPNGIAGDSAGNVFVHSDVPPVTTALTQFAPNGTPLRQINLGGVNPFEFGGSRLDRDPLTGIIFIAGGV